jgi:uncharacterized repeat protein (TIGR01451 family)
MHPLRKRRTLGLLSLATSAAALALLVGPVFAASTHEYSGTSFGPDGTLGTTFEHSGSVAIDQSTHDVYAADYGAGAIYKFNEKGEEAEFSALASNKIAGLSLLATESQIAVDSSSHVIYSAGGEHSSLKAFQANGEPAEFSALASHEIGGFADLCGVAVDSAGDIYAGDYGTGVHIYAPTGEEVASFPTTQSCNLAVDSHGDVYVNHWEQSVEKFAPSAYPVTHATTYASEGTVDETPTFGVTIDPSSDDLYADEKTAIAQYDEHGKLLATFAAAGPGAISASEGVAEDETSGDVYVSDGGGKRQVEIFGPLVPLIEHTLTVTNEGTTGTGTVTSSPGGIECGGTCSAQFAQNSTVTLTATPSAHDKLTGWSGPDAGSCGAALSCEVPIGTSDRAVTATFASAVTGWGLSVEHHNLYGAERASCPGGHQSLPGEPDCGVDPFTGSGTTFDRESGSNEYRISVKNTGEIPSDGPVSVADEVPNGLTIYTDFADRQGFLAAGWTCAIATGAHSLTCTRSDPLPPGAEYKPIVFHTSVSASAPDHGFDVASVSGGEAETTTAKDETVIAPAVPFGIQTFSTDIFGAGESPFVQALGHPLGVSTTIIFNSTPGEGNETFIAGGEARDVEAELPPGFLGNPQALSPCAKTGLRFQFCPHRSIAGFAQLSFSGSPLTGPIFRLQDNSLVNSIPAPPGHAAAFGFQRDQIPFTLYAKVRSDGDYGVTVGDSATGLPGPLAIKLTFCDNGVQEVELEPGRRVPTGCTPQAPTAAAFLTLPAKCSSPAPTTTLRASSWEHPETYVSKTVFNGANLTGEEPNPSESFLSGCDSPELGSRWTESSIGLNPSTTQVDAPTGMTFDLRTPQDEAADKLATPELKDTAVTLPAGMSVSPSAADGLEGCSDAQIAVHSLEPGSCPAGSQGATAEVFTPLLSASPAIRNVPQTGENLICSNGTWNGASSFAYQWLRDGVAISGATNREYTAVEADEGNAIQCQVSAVNTSGRSVAVSPEVDVEAPESEPSTESNPPLQQSRLAPPAGTASAGGTLSCGSAVWKGAPTFAYQWLRDGVPIAGANASTYTLTTVDEGRTVQCQVTATNADGSVLADGEAAVISPQPAALPPLLGAPVHGKVFIGSPLCSPCSDQDAQEGRIFRLFIEVADPERGVVVKLPGTVAANPATGQLTATFKDNPQLPFEDVRLAFKGGPRAPLATPQSCGEAKTTSDLTAWSAEPGIHEAQGTPDAFPSSAFNVDWDGRGGACPSSVPFAPGFLAQTASSAAGAFTPLTVEFSRGDREQDLGGVSVQTPQGLLGKIAGIPQCQEAQANAGTCSAESEIGTSTAQAGAGPDPFTVTGGRVYLTGPYEGRPFGLSIVVPAVAGPFNLGNVVVRASIAVNPVTGQLTVVSDPLPQLQDGVPFRLRRVKVEVNRASFILNPTNCSAQQVSATLTGVPLNPGEGAESAGGSSPFAAGGCSNLPFAPGFSASTQGAVSKASGASLDVKVAQAPGEANIRKVDVTVPAVLPARLTTLQKACLAAQFEANPAGCPAASNVGTAVAHTPLLNSPLTGPAYLVSHGGAAFPDLEVVLQGENITIVLDGSTDIKKGVTYSRFETVPDAPISSFEMTLPEGPYSLLAAPGGTCGQNLVMPTTIIAQNGRQTTQNTKIAVAGCTPAKPKPTIKITRTRLSGSGLLVTLKTSTKGTVTITGHGLSKLKKKLPAGIHRLRLTFTSTGRAAAHRHQKTKIHARLTTATQAAEKTTGIKL